jgi:mRNA interferase RelE/StbE
MDRYAISFARSARKELELLPDRIVEKIIKKIECLEDMPRPVGSRKLSGEKDLHRLRVGDYRIIYSLDDQKRPIDIIAVRHRKDAYR